MSQHCATYASKSKKDRKCDLPGRNSLVCILLLFGLLYAATASSAAVLELKTGQKVEGDYLGGSATEIKIKVGNQVVVFPVQDISRLHFVAPAPEGDFSGDSLKVLRVLKGLQSVTKAGVNLSEYSRRVNDAAIAIDQFLDAYKGKISQEILTEIRQAMAFYAEAASGWSSSPAWLLQYGAKIWVNEDVMKSCPTRYDPSKRASSKSVLLEVPLSDLWACASERIVKIEQLVTQQ